MRTPESARELLDGQRIEDWDERKQRALGQLSRKARAAGRAILEDHWWHYPEPQQKDTGSLVESLSSPERIELFASLFPSLGRHLDRMWEMGKALPYQTGYLRRAFRAPSAPNLTLPARRHRLLRIVDELRGFEPDAVWVARWAPHLGFEDVFGPLLAAVIDGGGADGDAVFEVLVASAEGQDDVGAMGRHITRAMLIAAREDGWDFVERLLLAAQRQEGLRQVILESIDEAHPRAFFRMLRLILEHDLARFSATIRAITI